MKTASVSTAFKWPPGRLVLGIVFATEVTKDLTMPDFSPTLLRINGYKFRDVSRIQAAGQEWLTIFPKRTLLKTSAEHLAGVNEKDWKFNYSFTIDWRQSSR